MTKGSKKRLKKTGKLNIADQTEADKYAASGTNRKDSGVRSRSTSHNQETPNRAAEVGSKKQVCGETEQNSSGQEVVYEDEDQLVVLPVEAEDDIFNNSELVEEEASSSENESCEETENSELPDEESEVQFHSREEYEQSQSLNWMDAEPSTSMNSEVVISPKEKMKQLDDEMTQQIQELHQMMLRQGMKGSVAMLQNCFTASGQPKANVSPSREQGKQISQHSSANSHKIKSNHNQNVSHSREAVPIVEGLSCTTIYESAVKQCNSSLSEEPMNFSDESLEMENDEAIILVDRHANGKQRQEWSPRMQDKQPEIQMTPQEKAANTIRKAELAKVKMFPPTGENNCYCTRFPTESNIPFELVAKVDQDYLVIGGHIDESTQLKIIIGKYIDFSKLIPRDKILVEEENRLELVVKNGRTFWSQVNETVSINCFSRWEQAFRIYLNVYTRAHPKKSSELIQYNHIIHSISLTYVWNNVYSYDKEFRLHLSKHPERNWSVILQQAWSMKLRDRLPRSGENFSNHRSSQQNYTSNSNQMSKSRRGDFCKLYNKGHFKFGSSCKFEHKCSYCGKFRHRVIHCRKLQADKERSAAGKVGSENNHG